MIKGVLFDLDGTLLDTAADLVGALNHVRGAEGMEAVALEDFRHYVSQGAAGLLRAGMPPADEVAFVHRKETFLSWYARNSTRRTKPFDGVTDLLQQLDARAVPWGIVTNKPEYLTLPILTALRLSSRAACVICGDTLAHSKPHPAPVELACELIRTAPGDTLMVGDDMRDIEAGRSAGTRTAFAAYGYVEPGFETSGLGDSFVVRHPREILDLLLRNPFS